MLVKHATFAVLDAWTGSDETPNRRHRRRGSRRTAHRHVFHYEAKPGFLYVRSRAISSRTNDNFDNFPAAELKKGWRSFIGKPVYVNHVNDDPNRARGVIIDAAIHDDVHADGRPDTWIEVLMEVDAVRFPKLAKAILAGEVDRTSMGCNVEYSECSACGNRAYTPLDYCAHIPGRKGQVHRRVLASGEVQEHRIYERCFPPGTSVLMADGTEQPIETIRPGDSVIDHLGQPRRVTGVMVNEFDGDLVSVTRTAFWKPLQATPEHPVMVLRGDGVRGGNRQRMTAQLSDGRLSPEFVPISEVQPGDYMAEVFIKAPGDLVKIITSEWATQDDIIAREHPEATISDRYYTPERAWGGRQHIIRACRSCGTEMDLYPSEGARLYCSSQCWGDGNARGNNAHGGSMAKVELPDTIEMSHDFGRWCGWFLAEGCISRQANGIRPRGVKFGLHEDEKDHIQEILRLGSDLFGLEGSVYTTKGSKGVTVEFFNAPLARLMKCLGESAYVKSVPDEWLSAPIEFIDGLVSAHCDGDGEHQGGRVGGVPDPTITTHATSSPRLADQLHVMHLMLGHTPTRKTPTPVGSGKRTVPSHHVRVPTTRDAKGRMSWGPWVFSHVKGVTRESYFGTVHNLEVEGTHTYVANHAAVHNCYGLAFFENSILVEDPADPTAAFLGVDDSGLAMPVMASRKVSAGYEDGWWRGISNPLVNQVKKRRGWVLQSEDRASIEHGGIRGNVSTGGSSGVRMDMDHNGQKWAKYYASEKSAMDAVERYMAKYGYGDPGWGDPQASIYLGDDASPRWGRQPMSSRTASRRHAYGEQVAPAEIDTLRAEKCPNCGESGAYSGTECSVCGFIAPPSQYMDPDLDAAGEIDRIQDTDDDSALKIDDGDLDGDLDELATLSDDELDALDDLDPDGDPGAELEPDEVDEDGKIPVDVDASGDLDEEGNNLPAGDDSPEINQYDFPRMEKSDEDSDISDVSVIDDDTIDEDAEDPGLDDDFEDMLDDDETDDDSDPSIDDEDDADEADSDAEQDDDESDDESNDDDGLKPRKKNAMRPALAQLTALRIRQQATLKAVGRIAAKTGVDISDIMGEAHGKLARLAAQSPKSPQARQAPASASARARARVQGGRPAPARQAPARMRRRADVENPAQPWPEPGSEGAFLPPENGASESLETPGLGTTIDTSADAVDDPTTIGLSLDDDGADATGDVTAPMEGTTEQRPDSETITEPEIQYRDLDPEGAFPVNFSESGSSPVESSLQRAQARVIAATRLANLRIAAGLASGDPIALMASISESAMTDRDIANETRTLMAVRQTAGAAPQARRLPVQAATRAVPSFSTQTASLAPTIGGNGLTDDDVLDIFGVDMSYTEPRTAARD